MAKRSYPSWAEPASINVCEGPDFAFNAYVAEPVNTVSSIVVFSVPAALSLYLTRRNDHHIHARPWTVLTYMSLLSIGVGSAALHASLLGLGQIGDELPMMYCVTMLAYNASVEIAVRYELEVGPVIPAAFSTLAVFTTVAYLFFHDVFMYFGFTFLGYVIVLCIYAFNELRHHPVAKHERETQRDVIAPLCIYAFAFITFACYCWAAEMGLCDDVEQGGWSLSIVILWRYGMHTGWHLFTAMAGHCACQIQVAISVRASRGVGIDWSLLPYVVIDSKLD